MKIYHLVFCFLFFAFAPVHSAEKQDAVRGNLEQQLLEIDLKVLLRQYEQIQTQLLDIQLQLAVLEGEPESGEGDIKKQIGRMQKKEAILAEQLHRTRTQIQIVGERMKQSSK